MLKEIGRYLAATNFLTKNPDWLMSLPIIAGHDSNDEMQWRTTFDERLTFPIDALPFELRKFLTADTVADLPASKAAASGAEGSRVHIKLTPAPARKWGVAYKYYRCPGRMWVAKAANGETINKYVECGLVLRACSQWTHTVHTGGKKKHRWTCKQCLMQWGAGKEGGWFVVIYDGTVVLQLIMDGPPIKEWNVWMKERIEFYKRIEPNDTVRNEIPMVPDAPISHRIRVKGQVSEAVWRVLYTNPDPQAMMQLDFLAQEAKSHEVATSCPRIEEMEVEV